MSHIEDYADLVAEHFTDVEWRGEWPNMVFSGTRNGTRENVAVFVTSVGAKSGRPQIIAEYGKHTAYFSNSYTVALHSGGYQIWRTGGSTGVRSRRPEFITRVEACRYEKVGDFVPFDSVSREEAKKEAAELVPDALAGLIAGFVPRGRKVDWDRVRQNWWNRYVHLHYLFLRDLDELDRHPNEMPEVDYTPQWGHEIIHMAQLKWRKYANQYRYCEPAPLIPALPPIDDNSFCVC